MIAFIAQFKFGYVITQDTKEISNQKRDFMNMLEEFMINFQKMNI